jgi:predicted nucleotidyltransferase
MQEIKAPLLNEAVERLAKEFAPEKIILFGSHVWGTPHADSDIDLFIIIKSTDLPPTQRATKAYRCLQGLKIPAEVIVSTQQEVEMYRSVPASLTRKILEKGRVVYG